MKYISSLSKQKSPGFIFIVTLSVLLALLNPLTSENLIAQAIPAPSDTSTVVHLTEAHWKALEGYFQLEEREELVVKFEASNSILVATLLWQNRKLYLTPLSALAFRSKQEGEQQPINVAFIRDSSGAINFAMVEQNRWKRITNYKPVVKTEIQHTPEQIKVFEGLYQSKNEETSFIQFSVRDNNLILKQHWDAEEIPFVPENATDFFCKNQQLFTLRFSKDGSGNISQVLAFGRDVWIKTAKPDITTAGLKKFEGKYLLEEDPDNAVSVRAKNDQLILKQLWDGKEIEVKPLTNTYFYNPEQSFSLQILKDSAGVYNRLKLLGNDYFRKVK